MNRTVFALVVVCFGVGVSIPFLYPTIQNALIFDNGPEAYLRLIADARTPADIRAALAKGIINMTPKPIPESKRSFMQEMVLQLTEVAAISSGELKTSQERTDYLLDRGVLPVRSRREREDKLRLADAAREKIKALAETSDSAQQFQCTQLRSVLDKFRSSLDEERSLGRKIDAILVEYFDAIGRRGVPKNPETGNYVISKEAMSAMAAITVVISKNRPKCCRDADVALLAFLDAQRS